MKIPKNIQSKMHKIADYSARASELSKEVDAFFDKKCVDMDLLRCGNGVSLDELEYGNDVTEKIVQAASNDFEDWKIKARY